MAAIIHAFYLVVLCLASSILAAYPYYPIPGRNLPSSVNQPPQYLIYPHGVYKLTNATNATQPKANDFVFGAKSPQDQLLLHTTIYKRPGIWSNYASKEITFPPPGSAIRVLITQVNAHDKEKNGTGGFVKMIRGGIGRDNVTLLFRSQKNRPINFELDVYGVSKR